MENSELYLCRLKLNPDFEDASRWTEETFTILEAHSNYLDDLGRRGRLLFAGRTSYDPGHEHLFGIVVVKAASLEDAEKLISPDPAVSHGIQQASLHPFHFACTWFENA